MTIAISTPTEWLTVNSVRRNSLEGNTVVDLEGGPISVNQQPLISWQLPDTQNPDGTRQMGQKVELFPARWQKVGFFSSGLLEGCWLQRFSSAAFPEMVDEIILDHKTGLAVVSNFLSECHPK